MKSKSIQNLIKKEKTERAEKIGKWIQKSVWYTFGIITLITFFFAIVKGDECTLITILFTIVSIVLLVTFAVFRVFPSLYTLRWQPSTEVLRTLATTRLKELKDSKDTEDEKIELQKFLASTNQ